MASFGGGMFTPITGGKVLTLSDTAGVDTFIVKDSDGFPLFKVDSKGNVYFRGGVQRI